MRAPINSTKHIVQQTVATSGMGAISSSLIVVAEEVATGAATVVAQGTVIKAVFIEMWFDANSQSTAGSTVATLEKQSGGQPAMTYAQSVDLHNYPNKKNLLATHMGLTAAQDANPVPAFRAWYKIPKGKQRFGLGDRLLLNISGITDDTNYCGLFIYKAYN